MPSKNMLPKGKRRQSVKKEYREQRTLAQEREAARGQEEEIATVATIATSDYMEHEPTLEERKATNNWFTTRGASGSKVAEETYDPPRYGNPYAHLKEPVRAEIEVIEDLEPEDGVRSFSAPATAAGVRIDAYLAKALPEVSRARVQLLIENGQATVDGKAAKSKLKLKGGELIEIEGEPMPEPLHAVAEDIPLKIVYEDEDLAVIDKAAGMMVHAGSGSGEHNRGTLVNALLHYFGKQLSEVGGELRPGIVHRLDKQTSGLIVVAKNDVTHRKLGEMFAERQVHKTYVALVHGWMAEDEGTVTLAISRDAVRRTRMTTKRAGGRSAVSHWKVLERIDGPWGKFTLVEVRIETGRTHQIRVHMQALGHSVVGDSLYGAPHVMKQVPLAIKPTGKKSVEQKNVEKGELALARNFLHASRLELKHPRTGKSIALKTELPAELEALLEQVQGQN